MIFSLLMLRLSGKDAGTHQRCAHGRRVPPPRRRHRLPAAPLAPAQRGVHHEGGEQALVPLSADDAPHLLP